MQKEILLLDSLIDSLGNESVDYRYSEFTSGIPFSFDASYFDSYIKSSLYRNFVEFIYDQIKPLNNFESIRFLKLSVIQFQSFDLASGRKKFITDYCESKWFPIMNIDISNNSAFTYASHVWDNFENHFHLFNNVANKILEDVNTGLLNSQFAPVNTNNSMKEPIKYEAYNQYLKQFEYNYPFNTTVFNFKYDMKAYLGYLKTEILDNIIILNSDSRKPYLNKIKNELHNNKLYAYTTQETIDEWLAKYNIESVDDIKLGRTNNDLYEILTADAPKFEDEFEESFNKDTRTIQTDFYNFYYGFYLDAAIDFINEQIKEHSPITMPSNDSKEMTPQPLPPKLKTNLTVPQLAYLFKMLMDINPPIFDIKSNKELYHFIEANFTTKGKVDAGPTVAKLNNLYSDVDKSTGNFWAEKLAKMLQDARKI